MQRWIYVYNEILFSYETKKILIYVWKQTEVEGVILSETRQALKDILHALTHMWKLERKMNLNLVQ